MTARGRDWGRETTQAGTQLLFHHKRKLLQNDVINFALFLHNQYCFPKIVKLQECEHHIKGKREKTKNVASFLWGQDDNLVLFYYFIKQKYTAAMRSAKLTKWFQCSCSPWNIMAAMTVNTINEMHSCNTFNCTSVKGPPLAA